MNASSATSRMMVLAALTCLFAANSSLASSRLDNLLSNSPFGQSKNGSAAPVTSNQALEFRGVIEERGQPLYSFFDATTKRTHWVSKHAPGSEIIIKSFDESTNTITVEQQGKPLTLTLKSGPRIAQQNPASIQGPPMPTGPNGLPGLPNPTPNVTGKGPEAQRLQQIAEEIRRRRALRSQAPQMPNSQPVQIQGQGGPLPMPNATPAQGGPLPMLLPGQSAPPGAGPTPMAGSTGSSPVLIQQPSR